MRRSERDGRVPGVAGWPVLLAAVLLIGACGEGGDRADDVDADVETDPASPGVGGLRPPAERERFATAGPIPAYPQRPGDPVRGFEALLGEPYVACGLPRRAWEALGGADSGPALPGRTGAGARLPYFNNLATDAAGVEQVTGNCLSCHGQSLFGEVVVGLGNAFTDWTGDASVAVERAGALVRGEAETLAWERYADRIAVIAPHIRMRTVGSNPANNLTFALIAHRDPVSNAWSETPLLPLPTTEPPPVSVPPWWRMKKKHAMFNLGEGRGDHARIMMAASVLCSDELEELDAIDAYAPDIRAYIESIEPPAWPFEIDRQMAERGRGTFEAVCSECHGRYGEGADGSYPNLLVPIEAVGTDPSLMRHALDEGVPYIDWFNASYYGELSQAQPGPGYVAPPLDGIWATAPFLHNGSVPNLSLMLDSTKRPDRWLMLAENGDDVDAYDTGLVGWHHRELGSGTDDAIDAATMLRVYDTTRAGHDNGGHTFGDHFTPAERAEVVEYLKTL